jgi:hypothetical protein
LRSVLSLLPFLSLAAYLSDVQLFSKRFSIGSIPVMITITRGSLSLYNYMAMLNSFVSHVIYDFLFTLFLHFFILSDLRIILTYIIF